MTTRPSLPALFPIDFGKVAIDVNRLFNPLHTDYALDFHVSEARDGYVFLSIALPEGITRSFVSFLESMVGFFRFVDVKARAASSQFKVNSPEKIATVERLQADFKANVLSLYDGFTGQGLDSKEAVKRTNAALKAQNNPWATHDIVLGVVRASGRLRKKRGRPHGNERSE